MPGKRRARRETRLESLDRSGRLDSRVELGRLERMTPASPEYQMIRTYLDWLLDVPWTTTTEDRLDPVAARQVLDEISVLIFS